MGRKDSHELCSSRAAKRNATARGLTSVLVATANGTVKRRLFDQARLDASQDIYIPQVLSLKSYQTAPVDCKCFRNQILRILMATGYLYMINYYYYYYFFIREDLVHL